MTLGIRDLQKVAKGYEVVRCNNCDLYYYDEIHDHRDNNALEFIWDEDCEEFFKGCRKCQTDDYLTDIDSEYLTTLQITQIAIHG